MIYLARDPRFSLIKINGFVFTILFTYENNFSEFILFAYSRITCENMAMVFIYKKRFIIITWQYCGIRVKLINIKITQKIIEIEYFWNKCGQ